MTATFASRLTGAGGRNLRLYATIAGVPFVFQEDRTISPPTSAVPDIANRTTIATIVKVEVGEKRLDMQQMRMVGGSLTITMNDDAAGTLAALFAPRSRPVAFVNADETAASTTINLSTTAAPIPAAGTVYIAGESIRYTSVTGGATPTLNGATRGAFGSRAQAHFGNTEEGARVFVVPPSWKGRRLTLGGFFIDAAGSTTTALSTVLDTFRLTDAPVYIGRGQWEIRCSHLSDEFLARKIGSGLRDIDAATGETGIITFDGTNFSVRVEANSDQFVPGLVPTFARLEMQNGSVSVYQLNSGTSLDELIFGSSPRDLVEHDSGASIMVSRARHIAILDGDAPGTQVLYALTSITGQGVNGAYDHLPGKARTLLGGDEWQFGAGILSTEVDTSAFLDVGSMPIPGWSYVIDAEISVGDFMRDFCLAAGCFWYVTNEGLLSVKRLAEVRQTSLLTINDDNLMIGGANGLEPTITYDEGTIHPRVELECNYDAAAREHLGSVTVVDVELANRYQDNGETLEISSRALTFDDARLRPTSSGQTGTMTRPSATRVQVQSILRRIQVSGGRGGALIVCRVTIDGLGLDLGDNVLFSDRLPDLEGAQTIAGRTCRVVAIAPDFDGGFVDLTLSVQETLFHIAPACVIDAESGAGTIMTLQLGDPASSNVPQPSRMFAAGWTVRIFDVSANTFVDRVVQGVLGANVTMTAAVGFAIQVGIDFIAIAPQANNLSTLLAANNNGFRPLEFTYHQATIPTGAPVSRWR